MSVSRLLTVCASLFWLSVSQPLSAEEKAAEKKVDFAKEIAPLFAQHCNECHGEEAQEGRLRLDAKQIVLKGGVSGPALVPGSADESLLMERILGEGGEERMPLDAEPLTDEQIELIERWINEGANWPENVGANVQNLKTHWAYVTPQRPELPAVNSPELIQNPIDLFTLRKLESQQLSFSPPATREQLIRRVTLDLHGLPPTIEEIEAFVNDVRPDAYEKLVDRLLAAPRYGERWAIPWLDAARYADSNGYQRDGRREYWAYRDWVVRSLNADLPFDQFTIEQLAGDLLPNRTQSQLVATGFHRGTMANVEAGTDPEEEYFLAVVDRVNTTGMVWLGTTLECAQCHNHKYDPFSQKDYYRLFAFFNSTEKEITRNGSAREFTGPKITLPLSELQENKKQQLTARLETLKTEQQMLVSNTESAFENWLAQQQAGVAERKANIEILNAEQVVGKNGTVYVKQEDLSWLATGPKPATETTVLTARTSMRPLTQLRLHTLTHASLGDGAGPGRESPPNFILSEFKLEAAPATEPDNFEKVELAAVVADYSQPNWDAAKSIDGDLKTGWAIGQQFKQPHHATFQLAKPLDFPAGTILRITMIQNYGRARTIGRLQLEVSDREILDGKLPAEIATLLNNPEQKLSKAARNKVRNYYLAQQPAWKKLDNNRKQLETQLNAIAAPTTLVMQELEEPRSTHILMRGDFLKPQQEVQPGTPASLPPLPDGVTANRLALAEWLISNENPLVGRVTVNRAWAEFFGRGLVNTIEDFGTQGDRPTHPELLDWLAVELRENGWSLKQLHRLIVTSRTYQQSSRVTPELLERDPFNALYTRGARYRLKAEFVRDNALNISGLLSQKLYGPPVFPYQPSGVWNHIGRASNAWTTSSGDNLYRRGLYVYWRRTVPYPSFVNFDAPSRETACVSRSRSNTPLQALTLMNDPVFLEAAAKFAERLLTNADSQTNTERLAAGFRLATSRPPTDRELTILNRQLELQQSYYAENPTLATDFSNRLKSLSELSPAERAAWVYLANLLLNLDEVITRN